MEIFNNEGVSITATEEIYITKNGNLVAKLSNPNQKRVEIAQSLFGAVPADITEEECRKERLDSI